MKQKIKKNRLKIFIALSLMITTILGVMFATNTFAKTDTNNNTYYEFNQNIQNGNFVDSTGWNGSSTTLSINNNIATITANVNSQYCGLTKQNVSLKQGHKYFISYNFNPSGNFRTCIYNGDGVQGQTNTTAYINNKINIIFTQNNNFSYILFYLNYSGSVIGDYAEISDVQLIDLTQMYGESNEPNTTNECINNFNLLGINLNEYQTYTTSKYLYISNNSNTEYQQLTNDYDEIDENYDTLQDDYYQLNNDYTQLENDYTNLQDNYDTLESNYTNLQQDLNNLTQTIDNGLWSYTSGVVAFGNGYGASYTTYQDILNAEIIKDFTFDCIKTYPTYTQQNNGISGDVNIVMGVLPNENTSNWNEVKYTPANLLNFNINTNITNYLKITIDLTTTNSTSQNRILQINKSNIELMNYEITSQKLEGLYDYTASNYRVNRIRIEWNKTSNNDYLYLVSTNINYTNGYTLGYYDGLKAINYDNEVKIQEQQNQIQQLEQRIESLETTIETKNEQIATYARSSYGLNNLMWTIGSTPFESFKQIWNVEFLGVDIANFILGIITTFIGLYIVKKFFL